MIRSKLVRGKQALPYELDQLISELRQCKSKDDVLSAAYELLTNKYRGYRIKTVTRVHDLFMFDTARIWARSGFLHCTKMNTLLKTMLIGSEKFDKKDIKSRWTAIFYFFPHQYLKVRLGENEWTNVDIWGKAYGIKLGSYGHGFQSGSLRSIEE